MDKEKKLEKNTKNKKYKNKTKKKQKKEKNKEKNLKLKDKLNFIGIDKNKIPDFLKSKEKPKFELNSLATENSQKVFIYLDIRKLEFLITEKNKDDELYQKYINSKNISEYLKFDSKDEKDIINAEKFLNIAQNIDIKEINRIEKMQNILNKKTPDTIKYFRSTMWNIFYSQKDQKYFMLVSLENLEFNEFIFALKKKIEATKKDEEYKIYIPINYLEQSEEILKTSEKNEIENILWYFTRNWPISYDTYDKNGKYTFNYVGDINLIDRIKGRYLIKLENREEGIKLYKFLKAIYYLEKETNKYVQFKIVLDENSNIEIIYDNKKINYEDLPNILIKIYENIFKKYKWYEEKIYDRAEENASLKKLIEEKEKKYQKYQYEIVKYLNIKNSFFGRFKYFFQNSVLSKRFLKAKKRDESNLSLLENEEIKKIKDETQKEIEKEIKKVDESIKINEINLKKEIKDITIEDISKIYKIYIKLYEKTRSLVNDINAAKLFLINIDKKIANAIKYLEEIEFSKRSIFSFWKFTNKDNVKELSEADEIKLPHEKTNDEKKLEEKISKKEKIFNFDMDFEKVAEEKDGIQREKLNEDEINAALITLKLIEEINFSEDKKLEKSLEELKNEFKNQKNYIGEEYNIFGQNDKQTLIRYMKDKSFREKDRNIFEAINFNKNINLDEYKNKLEEIKNNLKSALKKIKTDQKISLYFLEEDKEKTKDNNKDKINKEKVNNFKIVNLDVEDELKKYKGKEKNLKLIKLNIEKEIGIIFLTNIIFYTNLNKTLPLGMEDSSKCIIDLNELNLDKTKILEEKEIYLNNYFDKEFNIDKDIPYNLYDKIVMENNIKKIKFIEYKIK